MEIKRREEPPDHNADVEACVNTLNSMAAE
jgi:hypothetical protein